MSSLIFGAPWLLLTLALLPTFWWLLRLTPPHPEKEVFPPLKILAKITDFAGSAQKSPWWLTLLRLIIAGLIILALAQPALRPKPVNLTEDTPLLLIIDNSFAAAASWQQHRKIAETLIEQAKSKEIFLVATADPTNQEISALTSQEALKKLATLEVKPLPANRKAMFAKIAGLFSKTEQAFDIAYLTDGLAEPGDREGFETLKTLNAKQIFWYQGDIQGLIGITSIANNSQALEVTLVRPMQSQSRSIALIANDIKGRVIGQTTAVFKANRDIAQASFFLPLELRNDISNIKIQSQENVAAIYLTDSRAKRQKVAILTVSASEMTQPLLSPMYYVIKALSGSNEVILSKNGQLKDDIADLLNQSPATLILGDLANIAPEVQEQLNQFLNDGGTIIRFAGPRLANEQSNDSLLPVKLRLGERGFGGVMSWTTPQRLSSFAKNSAFADLPPPRDIKINREILADPDPELLDKTWVSLEDGTPLVTATKRGKGTLVFIHTSPDPSWSNIAFSGFFVEFLKRMVDFSHFDSSNIALNFGKEPLAPWRVVTSDGRLSDDTGSAQPLILANDRITPSIHHPAGLYGNEQNFYALNLLDKNSKFLPIDISPIKNIIIRDYSHRPYIGLTGILLTIALILFVVDCIIIINPKHLWTNGKRVALIVATASIIFGGGSLIDSRASFADAAKSDKAGVEQKMIDAAGSTHLAYVKTGNKDFDESSKAGLEALSSFVEARSSVELGNVVEVDLDYDELAFYPLIYWPVDPEQPMPSPEAIANVDAYMQHGGTVLFDTRDQLSSNLSLKDDITPANQRLRAILQGMNIPRLEPVSKDNVLSRSFYIMPDFPGRYRGGMLWAEAANDTPKTDAPIHGADGVSPILITSNDFSDAWATDSNGRWKYPIVPDNQSQRLWAFRGGMNIIMYVLTGNYKADQIHAPELLKRFGNGSDN